MDRDKQIKEMVKTLNEATFGVNKHIIADHIHKPEAIEEIVTHLYNAGYRKSTNLAEEIFAEIEKTIADLEYRANTPRKTVKVEELKAQVNWVLHEVVPQTLAELKKKYTEASE